MKGRIADIKRFSTSDGPGIRTVLFLQGCPLACRWCANPEAQGSSPCVLYYKNKCIFCGKCESVCSEHAIHRTEQGFLSGPECIGCGRCVEACLSDARKLVGESMDSSALLKLLEKDRVYYNASGGGVTLSGGEVFSQTEFAAEILDLCREKQIHTAIETSFFTTRDKIDKVLPLTDHIMCDIKTMNNKEHMRQTGVSNGIILDNIRYVTDQYSEIPMTIRIPYIPGFNDSPEEIRNIFSFVSSLKKEVRVELLPYHRLGSAKYGALGISYMLEGIAPVEKSDLDNYVQMGTKMGLTVCVDAGE